MVSTVPVLVASGDVFDLTQLRIFTEPQQGATYDDLLAVAQRAEQLGFGAFFRSDHYLAMGDALAGRRTTRPDRCVDHAGRAGPRHLDHPPRNARQPGDVPYPACWRSPSPTSTRCPAGGSSSASGAGWYEQEHTSYGIPFPDLGERFDRLEEQLEIVTGLWSTPIGERFNFAGTHYDLSDSPALPKPAQATDLPIIVGGGGPRRTPSLAARFAAEFNLAFRSLRTSRPSDSGSSSLFGHRPGPGDRCRFPPRWWSPSAPMKASTFAGRRRLATSQMTCGGTRLPA